MVLLWNRAKISASPVSRARKKSSNISDYSIIGSDRVRQTSSQVSRQEEGTQEGRHCANYISKEEMLPQQIACTLDSSYRTNCSILNELHLTTNWLYKLVKRQQFKYFVHVTRHNGLEKTIMQGMAAGKRSRGKPRKRWEKYIIDRDTFGTMAAAASIVAEDRHQFHRYIWGATTRIEGSILREEEDIYVITTFTLYLISVV